MYRIRKAVPEDEARIRELFTEMQNTIYRTEDAEGYGAGYLEKFWNGGEDVIFVAEGSEVNGFLSAEVYRFPEGYVYIDDLSVTETCRNRGIGTALVRTAGSYARDLGIPLILLHAEKTNRGAVRFYERLGFSVCRDDGDRYLMKKIIL